MSMLLALCFYFAHLSHYIEKIKVVEVIVIETSQTSSSFPCDIIKAELITEGEIERE